MGGILMKKKQIYALLTATMLMATSITGCSGKATEETAVEETTEAEETETPEEEPEAVVLPLRSLILQMQNMMSRQTAGAAYQGSI